MAATGMPLDHAARLLTIPNLSQHESLPRMRSLSQSAFDPTGLLRFSDCVPYGTQRLAFEDLRASQYILKVQWRIIHARHRYSERYCRIAAETPKARASIVHRDGQ